MIRALDSNFQRPSAFWVATVDIAEISFHHRETMAEAALQIGHAAQELDFVNGEVALPLFAPIMPVFGDVDEFGSRDSHARAVGQCDSLKSMATIAEIGSLLSRSPEIRGGRPCVAGTGVSVRRIAQWHAMGRIPEEITRKFGHLSLAQVHAALAYYHANQAKIDADLRC